MIMVLASLAVGRSVAGYAVVGHKTGLSRPGWLQVLSDPIVPWQLNQPSKSCVGVELAAAATPKMAAVMPEKAIAVTVAPAGSLEKEIWVTNLWVPFVLEGSCCS